MSGGKWLAVGALGLVVLVALLLHEMNAPAATVVVKAAPPPVAVTPPPAPSPAAKALAKVAAATAPEPKSDRIDPGSDEFIRQFTDVVPVVISRKMMRECYKGGLHTRDRDQSITINFVEHIQHGDVTFDHVQVDKSQSNLGDDELQACFLAQFSKVHWHNDRFPDYYGPDQITLNPERGGKKYLDEELNYVGAEAPPNTPRD
jgi:hypothetical protein